MLGCEICTVCFYPTDSVDMGGRCISCGLDFVLSTEGEEAAALEAAELLAVGML
jgi:hypothetical protein